MNYSQNDEQQVLETLLRGIKHGSLLDIGAYVPDKFSNSRSLIDSGWSAVLVEPSPVPFTALLRHYGGNSKVQLVNVAVVPSEPGWRIFYDSNGDALSSCSSAHKAKWEAASAVNFSQYSLNAVTVSELIKKFGCGFEFINLDVEGTNLELFQCLPLDSMAKLKAVCVEHDGHYSKMIALAEPFGFRKMSQNGENLILAR